jgi:collagen beta-1,O-galactosyltransferase
MIIGIIIDKYSYKYNIISNKINKVFLINLKRRKDRLAFFKSHYNLQIPLTICEASDGKLLDLQQLLKDKIINEDTIVSINTSRKHHYELTNEGSIGCYLSHYNIWKSLIDNNENKKNSNYLIFEDDSIFTNITLNEINYRLSLLPKNWDIYLLTNPDYCYNKIELFDSYKDLYIVKRFFLTSAYIINTNGIKKIFATQTIFPIKQQIDSYLSELAMDYNLNIYIHNKKYNYYNQSQVFNSDIQETNANNTLTYKRCLL